MKSFFGKTFTYYIIFLLMVVVMLSLGFTEIYRRSFYNEQNDHLLNQAIKIGDIYIDSKTENFDDEDYFANEIKILDKYIDYSFFVVDSDLNVMTKSKDITTLSPGDSIEKFNNYNDVLNGEIEWFQGNISKVYSRDRYILCYPTILDNKVEAIVVVSVPLVELMANMNKVYLIVAFFFVLALIIGFIIIHWASIEFIRPIKRLNILANHIAKGNFDEQIKIRKNLNNEIAEVCKSFNAMAESLNNLEKRRREFISDISHDLRSPITSIRGFLQAMLDGTISEDKYRHYIEIIYNETGRLSKLVNNIVDLNKLDKIENALNITEFDINEVIFESVKLMSGKAASKNIYLDFSTEEDKIMVKADIEKITRVLNNLIDNAVKFTNKGYVIIKLRTDGSKAYITVKDTGIGMSDEEQSRIFERLYKTDASRGMDKSGNGLGLAIVKEFIKAHNQKIEVKSILGEGSMFTFTLDLSK